MSGCAALQNHATIARSANALDGSDAAFDPGFPVPMAGLPPIGDVIRAAAEIRSSPRGVADMDPKRAHLETTWLETHGDTAVEVGRYQLSLADTGPVAEEGQYIIVWKHDGGEWMFHRGIWTTRQPATAPARGRAVRTLARGADSRRPTLFGEAFR